MPSSSISSVVEESLREARRLPPPETSGASEVVVAICPGAGPGGLQYYLALRHSGVRAVRSSCVEAAVHVLPYTTGGEAVVAFTASPRDPHLAHLASAASALGVEVTAYGPPLHPAYADKLAELGVVYREAGGRALHLTLMIAAILWAPKPWGPRRERLEAEIEALPSSPDWLSATYPEAIDALRRGVSVAAYTPATEGGVAALASQLGIGTAPLSRVDGLRGERVAALYTSAEEHAYKQVLLAARMRGVSLVEVRINTDPLTASLYAAILGLLASSHG